MREGARGAEARRAVHAASAAQHASVLTAQARMRAKDAPNAYVCCLFTAV